MFLNFRRARKRGHRLTFFWRVDIFMYRLLSQRDVRPWFGSLENWNQDWFENRHYIGEVAGATPKRSRQSLIFRATDPFGVNWKTRAARERSSRPREDTQGLVWLPFRFWKDSFHIRPRMRRVHRLCLYVKYVCDKFKEFSLEAISKREMFI